MEPIEKHDLNTVHEDYFFSGIVVIPLLRRESIILFCSQHHNTFCVSESISISEITKPLGNCTVNFHLYFLMHGYRAIDQDLFCIYSFT